jgi:hypothetical protein
VLRERTLKFSEYLNISRLRYAGELTVFCAAVLGPRSASSGTTHPADVFMGIPKPLALGGALGTVAVLIKREFWLVLVGVFVAEALSVMIRSSRSRSGAKRVFRMSFPATISSCWAGPSRASCCASHRWALLALLSLHLQAAMSERMPMPGKSR